MTTRVTVDAHAGWPVLVVSTLGEYNQDKTIQQVVVAPGTVQDFYIHSGMNIIHIGEQKFISNDGN